VERVRYYAAGEALRAMRRTVQSERAGDFVELQEWWPTTSIGAVA
jgi:hypothetical protein